MNNPILSSTLLLTILLMVGLLFFIRGSVKDRTKEVKLISWEPEESLSLQLQAYFAGRAYNLADADRSQNQFAFEGWVRPSWFLAIFLTCLAALGLLCLSLVLSFLYPSIGNIFLSLTLIAPGAGIFYWQKAGRWERVLLKVDTLSGPDQSPRPLLTITAHRDELRQIQQQLPLKPLGEHD